MEMFLLEIIDAEIFFNNIQHDTLRQRYILIGEVYKKTPFPNDDLKIAIVHLSYDYEVLFDTIIGGNDLIYSSIFTSNGDLALMSFKEPWNNDWRVIIRKTDIFGHIKKEKLYNPDEVFFVADFIELPNSAYYICDTHLGQDLAYFDTATLEVVKKDRLHYIEKDDYHSTLTGFSYNKDKAALVCTFLHDKLDVNNNLLSFMGWDTTTLDNRVVESKSVKMRFNSGAWYHGRTLWIDDNIYMAGTAPMKCNSEHDFEEIDNAVLLQKFNIDGSLVWSRSYMSLNDSMQYSVLPPIADKRPVI